MKKILYAAIIAILCLNTGKAFNQKYYPRFAVVLSFANFEVAEKLQIIYVMPSIICRRPLSD
jgi:hypothetical protein